MTTTETHPDTLDPATRMRIERDEQFREARKQTRRADAAEAECDRQAKRATRLEREVNLLREMLGTTRQRCEAAEAKVRAVWTVRTWRNEDGKDFVFADDLRAALKAAGQ